MSRRDTIIVAVLINAGLLAILFATAVNVDDRQLVRQADEEIEMAAVEAPQTEEAVAVAPNPTQGDEVDQVLEQHAVAKVEEVKPAPAKETAASSKPAPSKTEVAVAKEESKQSSTSESSAKTVEVTVKRGDFLERIARNNDTTVQDIMDANGLKTSHLRVGQVLKVPVGTKAKAVPATTSTKQTPEEFGTDMEYYTIQSGDNPWLIARRFGVKFDELLDLNGLDESKARRLRPGDRIRIR